MWQLPRNDNPRSTRVTRSDPLRPDRTRSDPFTLLAREAGSVSRWVISADDFTLLDAGREPDLSADVHCADAWTRRSSARDGTSESSLG
jgi:hypothetical protein